MSSFLFWSKMIKIFLIFFIYNSRGVVTPKINKIKKEM